MRTTLDIDDDILVAVKELARRDRTSAGSVLSGLARRSLTGIAEPGTQAGRQKSICGFVPFPARPGGVVITNEMIDRLRDVEGV